MHWATPYSVAPGAATRAPPVLPAAEGYVGDVDVETFEESANRVRVALATRKKAEAETATLSAAEEEFLISLARIASAGTDAAFVIHNPGHPTAVVEFTDANGHWVGLSPDLDLQVRIIVAETLGTHRADGTARVPRRIPLT